MTTPHPAPATSAQLRDSVVPIWRVLLDHPFPAAIAAATLPPERFRFYLTQNLRYLADYSRMIAVAASRSVDDVTLREYTDALVNIVHTEIPENERLLAAITEIAGPGPADETMMAPATVSYASWLMATAATGDAVDISAALLPCAWSYGEIATALAPGAVEHPVYREWIAFFASDAYAAVVASLRESFDRELADATERKRGRLAEIFLMGCRMELQFWNQGWSGATWPDLEPATAPSPS